MNENNETIQEITKSYEEKIVNLEKEHQKEIQVIKDNFEVEKKKALDEQRVIFNKEIADIILGRKEINEIQNKDEENDKSFFDIAVEKTKEKLKGGK